MHTNNQSLSITGDVHENAPKSKELQMYGDKNSFSPVQLVLNKHQFFFAADLNTRNTLALQEQLITQIFRMPLSAFESMVLTFAIVGSVHLLVTLLASLENDDLDNRAIMKDLAKYKFMHENRIHSTKVPFFH
ncbi:hypothetical protein HUJ04_004240 [Dendroctonus ponderosae]|nr:hypothetical protein HUJ04_004240 [Dendroctonus ponderosae]